PPLAAHDARLLWMAGLSPLALTLAVGLLADMPLQSRWGTNGFVLAGWLAMAAWRRADTPPMLARCLRFAALAHLVMCLVFTLSKTVLADHVGRRTRANFPGAVLAGHAMHTWRQHTTVPLRVV